MAISEETRHRLYGRLEEVLGPEEATTLMEHLPPVGWADVATKRDLDVLEERIDSLGERLSHDMGSLESRLDGRLDRELRLQTWRIVTAMIAVASLVVAGLRF